MYTFSGSNCLYSAKFSPRRVRVQPRRYNSQRGFLLNPFRFSSPWPPLPTAASVLADDANYAKCTVLLQMNGSNGSTSFIDQIGSSWTANGNAQITTSSPIYGSACGLFDGTGDYLSATISDCIGTGDFTIRAKIKLASLSSDAEIFCISNSSTGTSTFDLVFEVKTTGAIRLSIQNGSGTANCDISSAVGTIAADTAYEVAAVADGSTARVYVGGVQVTSGPITGTRVQGQTSVRVGFLSSEYGGIYARYFNGRIKGLQVYKGVCLYPGGTTYTPPGNVDRPALPALVHTSAFSIASTTDAQGIACDGTNIWCSSSTTLYKYSMAGSLVTSRSVTGDNPTTKDQINGLFLKDGILYVSAMKYTAGVGTSWIIEYDPSTLLPTGVTHSLDISGITEAVAEGLAWYKGFWWVCFHATQKVAAYTLDFSTRVALLDLGFTISGISGGYGSGFGYDGVAWMGDYLLANLHETYDQKFLDVYYWNGVSFDQVSRIFRSRSAQSQGLAFDTSDATKLHFAERTYGGGNDLAAIRTVA